MGWSKLLCGRRDAGVRKVRGRAIVRQQRARVPRGRSSPASQSCLFTWCGEHLVYRQPIETSGPGFISTLQAVIARQRPGLPQPPVNLVSWAAGVHPAVANRQPEDASGQFEQGALLV